jgi:hypothetical protein
MTGEVIKLVPKTELTNANVIEALENVLAIAREEGLVGVAIVGVDVEGATLHCFEPGENIATLIGGLARLNKRILEHGEA